MSAKAPPCQTSEQTQTALPPFSDLSFSFALDREQVKHTNSGVKRSRATLGDDGELDEVVIVTTMLRPGGSSVIVVEARKLLNRGQIHQQVRVWVSPSKTWYMSTKPALYIFVYICIFIYIYLYILRVLLSSLSSDYVCVA